MLLVLWDVDHTLIESGGVGGAVFKDAFRQVTGRELTASGQVQGALEPELFAAGCAANGVAGDPAGLFGAFAAVQADLYRQRAGLLRGHGRVLPGVAGLLERLDADPGVVSTVLSGNTAGAGVAKLEAFGVAGLLDLEIAAWGTDAPNRAGLAPVAWARAGAKYGARFGPATTLTVGDTPADVAAAAANDVRCLAVATGRFGVDDLAGAWRVVEDLTGAAAVIAAFPG